MSSFLTTLPLPVDIQQQFSWLQEMRTTQPVFHDEEKGIWHVFSYKDVNQVLHDPAHFSSHAHVLMDAQEVQGDDFFGQSFLAMDPPRHRLYRGLVSQAFTPRAITQLTSRIGTIVQGLLDQVHTQGRMEVVRELTYPLPATVIAEMLGVPLEERDVLRRYTNALVDKEFTDPETGQNISEQQAMQEMAVLFSELLQARRKKPAEDLISGLLQAELDGQRLSDQELISFCILLFIAGHETTTKLLGNFLLCLTEYPRLQQRLRDQPELMQSATEEVLRTLPPVHALPRLTTETVSLGDVQIPPEQLVLIWLASANYDSAQFSQSETFDIERTPNRHLSFGHGIHACIGAPLARLETSIVLQMLLQQFSDIRRIEDAPLAFSSTDAVFGVKELWLSFSAKR